jgi:hypothetical protein
MRAKMETALRTSVRRATAGADAAPKIDLQSVGYRYAERLLRRQRRGRAVQWARADRSAGKSEATLHVSARVNLRCKGPGTRRALERANPWPSSTT